ncbi:MAG: methylenetetrahydrofolate reductase [NAD(P)H] [Leptospiraceae bacterium]|nr:methylenetetrahydrofolate reductase [NAD(P)H] [Leptospiraceae bacterium]MDW7976659.1 methylenetetrahydrofolate reductase [NAD(P)H] [Leptospiraceae bacterium]
MHKIKDILLNTKPTFSFEFFPPKTEEAERKFKLSLLDLKRLKPDFVSITYGAGGSTKEKTEALVIEIQNQDLLVSMAHLTCIGSSKEEIGFLLNQYKKANIQNIMALRGDLPKNKDIHLVNDFRYAYELIQWIKLQYNDFFSIGAACYPEKHPEAKTLKEDIEYLKLKVDSGADFLITQLFYDNDKFYLFRDMARKMGIHVPIIAGIMPITNYQQIQKFTQMVQCHIPKNLEKLIEKYKDSQEDLLKVSIEYSIQQCEDLINNDIDGIHFYTLNQSNATYLILSELKKIYQKNLNLYE